MGTETKHTRIKYKDFINLTDIDTISNYILAIKHSDYYNIPEDCLGVGDLFDKKFGDIKDLQVELQNENYESFDLNSQISFLKKFIGCDDKFIDNCYLDQIIKSIKYMLESMNQLLENENITLKSNIPISYEEESAGIDRFNDLGVYMQIRNLANNDVTKIKDVRNTSYSDCYLELYARKVEGEFKYDLQKIFDNKNKINN